MSNAETKNAENKLENLQAISDYCASKIRPQKEDMKSAESKLQNALSVLFAKKSEIVAKKLEEENALKEAARIAEAKANNVEETAVAVEIVETVSIEEEPKTEEIKEVKEEKPASDGGYTSSKTFDISGARPDYQQRQQQPRPQQQQTQRPPYQQQSRPNNNMRTGGGAAPIIEHPKNVKSNNNNDAAKKKKTFERDDAARRAAAKKSGGKKGFDNTFIDENGEVLFRHIKARRSKKQEFVKPQDVKIDYAVINSEEITIKSLSEKIGVTAPQIIKKLFELGDTKTINQNISFEQAELIALEFGVTIELKLDKTAEEKMLDLIVDDAGSSELVKRPPVVTIMGHVDHGKTSLLDYIRKANVVSGEAGGITQHIGAYTIQLNGQPITFLDTPGHEAFTSMRLRGAMVTDIAVIVVAADDGIMPQTVEAINHAKKANVSIIVAVNKMDKPDANPERIKQQLTNYDIVPEEWGGDVIVCPVSAKSGEGVTALLENILLLADIKELKASVNCAAQGSIIEARLDKGTGPVATVLVQNGTLHVSDFVVAGTTIGKIRAMTDYLGNRVKEAGPSIAVAVLGFQDVPNAGDQMIVVKDEKLSKQVAEERRVRERSSISGASSKRTLEEIFKNSADADKKNLNVIIKGDVQGSVEAIKQAMEKLSDSKDEDGLKISVLHAAVGAVNESDVMLADTSDSIIIAFNVRPDPKARQLSDRSGVDIRTYRIIYDVINDITAALEGMLEPTFREEVLGHAEVREVFKITGVGAIAGSYVLDGKIVRNAKVRVLRDNIVVFEGNISSLKRMKDDVKDVSFGYECGIGIEKFNDIKKDDIIEAFSMEKE